MRGLLDGHVVLSRKLAERGHYPAIDVLQSTSRLMPQVVPDRQAQQAQRVTELLAAYREHEDLISIGAYQTGTNEVVDRALAWMPAIEDFTKQATHACSPYNQSLEQLASLAEQATKLPADSPESATSPYTSNEGASW